MQELTDKNIKLIDEKVHLKKKFNDNMNLKHVAIIMMKWRWGIKKKFRNYGHKKGIEQ